MEEDKEKRTLSAIASLVDLKGRRILEIGCGDGRVTAMLAGIPDRLAAIDPDADNVRKAAVKVSGTAFAAGSGGHLPFGADAFDTVIFTLSLHHQDSVHALAEAGRVLSDGGCIVAIEPDPDGEIERLCCLVEDESCRLAAAAAAMADAPFSMACDERFSTRWVFDGRSDLLGWLFAYYDRPEDPAIVRKVDRFLKNRTIHGPLVLHDHLRIVRLDKLDRDDPARPYRQPINR